MSGDVFIVTQAGLNAATNAASHGIFVVLDTFKVGSAFGYTPTKADTHLHGTTLYTDNITSYATDGQGNLILTLTINPTAGPFQFGEVGIYTNGGTLFALMALPNLENKYSSLGTNVASTFTFTCYMRLGQAGDVIQIVAGGSSGGVIFNSSLGPGAQPSFVWGTNDGTNSYEWDPSGFIVSGANEATTSQGVFNGTTAVYRANQHQFQNLGSSVLATINNIGQMSVGAAFSAETVTATTGNVTAFSDPRLKENIEPIENALNTVLQLDGVTFNMIGSKKRSMGFLANEKTRSLMPEVVDLDAHGSGYYTLAYGNVSALLVEALQEEHALNQALTHRISALERYLESMG